MKKLFTGLFAVLLIPAFSQITIESSDMPDDNDTIRLSIAYSIDGLDYEATGENYSWDFSKIAVITQRVDTFVNSLNTPWYYQTVFIPVLVANMAQPLFEFDWIPGYELTDVYSYYKLTDDYFKEVGFAFSITGIPIPVKYEDPDNLYSFPINYSDKDSTIASYDLNFLGMAYVEGWKKRVNYADGWGTLKTRFGSFDVLRVKTEITQYDSIYIDSLNFGFPVNRQYILYKWLGNDQGLPLLQVKDEEGILTIQYVDSARQSTFGIEEKYANISAAVVYPNPTDGMFTVDFILDNSTDVMVDLVRLDGELIQSFPGRKYIKGKNSIKINTEKNLSKGIYFIRIYSAEEVITKRAVVM